MDFVISLRDFCRMDMRCFISVYFGGANLLGDFRGVLSYSVLKTFSFSLGAY